MAKLWLRAIEPLLKKHPGVRGISPSTSSNPNFEAYWRDFMRSCGSKCSLYCASAHIYGSADRSVSQSMGKLTVRSLTRGHADSAVVPRRSASCRRQGHAALHHRVRQPQELRQGESGLHQAGDVAPPRASVGQANCGLLAHVGRPVRLEWQADHGAPRPLPRRSPAQLGKAWVDA